MSIDLEIITSSRPEHTHLQEFVSSREHFGIQGELFTGQGSLVITRRMKTRTLWSFNVYGPFRVELDDLNDMVLGHVLAPRWLLKISVPIAAPKVDFSAARALARHLADRCKGVVYDPQIGAIVWPKGKRKRHTPPAGRYRIRLIRLKWFVSPSESSLKTARLFLDVLRKTCPEAVPLRFGTYEPFQGRLEEGDDEPLLRIWVEESKAPYGGSLYFKSRSPCFGGTVSYPDPRDVHKPEDSGRALKLGLDFDGRALHGDIRWCEAIALLFVEMARGLRAFYAAGYVERDVIAGRGGALYDGRSESYPMPRGRWWFGIPPAPTWLAWFGVPYRKEVELFLPESCVTNTPEGILARFGQEPVDLDELRDVFPKLPTSLLAGMDEEMMGLSAEFMPNLD